MASRSLPLNHLSSLLTSLCSSVSRVGIENQHSLSKIVVCSTLLHSLDRSLLPYKLLSGYSVTSSLHLSSYASEECLDTVLN